LKKFGKAWKSLEKPEKAGQILGILFTPGIPGILEILGIPRIPGSLGISWVAPMRTTTGNGRQRQARQVTTDNDRQRKQKQATASNDRQRQAMTGRNRQRQETADTE